MRLISRLRPSPAMGVGLAALVVAATGTAIGAIPGGDGRIESCYDKQGRLRVIDAVTGEQCAKHEQSLVFSQEGTPGPQGPQGEPGPAGPKGDAGPQGPAGDLSGVETYTRSAELVFTPDGGNNKLIECDDLDDLAIGGGYFGAFEGLTVTGSFLSPDDSNKDAWFIQADNTTSENQSMRGVVVCLRVD